MTFKFLTGAVAATAAFVLAMSMALGNPTSKPVVSTQTCPNTATTTNGTATSKGGVVEGAIPTSNTTKTTNSTQNGSPLEHTVLNPTNSMDMPCAEGQAKGGTTATVRSNQLAGRNMLTQNPNGSNWLSKYNRSTSVSRTNPPH